MESSLSMCLSLGRRMVGSNHSAMLESCEVGRPECMRLKDLEYLFGYKEVRVFIGEKRLSEVAGHLHGYRCRTLMARKKKKGCNI